MKLKKWLMAAGALHLLVLGACSDANEEQVQTPAAAEEQTEIKEDPSSQEINEESKEQARLDLEENILNPDSTAVLVNKQYSLDENYAPDDLVTVEVPTVLDNPEIKQMRVEAADALKEMFEAAEAEGLFLHARSGYRSYGTQVELFSSYVANHGEEAANLYSARPGESEHQTGLVMDVTSEGVNYQLTEEFENTPEGAWVRDNAHEYGFIVRYPKGKEEVTGYIYEPWHIRYLGRDLAVEVYESGLAYEEYLIERGIELETN